MTSIAEQVGRVVGGRYRLLAPVGAGASSHVYAAIDTRLGRRVAVKLLHPMLAVDSAFLRRFQAEARLAASLDHPHIMRVFDWGEEEAGPYLVLEYLGGGSLRGLLDADVLLSHPQAASIGWQAAAGLAYAHRRGIIHRDIKPGNLLFDDEGHLRIADFGVARALAESALTEPLGAMFGTARYASPEQAEGRPLDDRTDVYSLTLVLYEAVTGRLPFARETVSGTLMARVGATLPPARELGPLTPILAQAAISEPLARLDAVSMAADLELLCRQLPQPQPIPLDRIDTRAWGGRWIERDPTNLERAGGFDDLTMFEGYAGQAPRPTGLGSTPGGSDVGPGAAGSAGSARRGGAAGVGVGGVGATGLAAGGVGGGIPSPPNLTGRVAPPPAREAPPGPGGPPSVRMAPATAVGPGLGYHPDRQAAGVILPPGTESGGTYSGVVVAPPKRRRWRRWLLVAVVLLLAAGGGTVAVMRYDVYGHVVPNLEGRSLTAAEGAAHHAGLVARETSRRYDAAVPAGRVAWQSIGGGSHERQGTVIDVSVSLGARPVPVPDLARKSIASAEAALRTSHLLPGLVRYEYTMSVKQHEVISWSNERRAVVPGTRIDLLVSAGPPFEKLGDLKGLPYSEAAASVEKAHLKPVRRDQYSHVTRGAVISTSPAAGRSVREGSTVIVNVSLGPPMTTVPPLIGLSVHAAERVLANHDLPVETIYGPSEGVVIASSPSPGERVVEGTPMALWVF